MCVCVPIKKHPNRPGPLQPAMAPVQCPVPLLDATCLNDMTDMPSHRGSYSLHICSNRYNHLALKMDTAMLKLANTEVQCHLIAVYNSLANPAFQLLDQQTCTDEKYSRQKPPLTPADIHWCSGAYNQKTVLSTSSRESVGISTNLGLWPLGAPGANIQTTQIELHWNLTVLLLWSK